VAISGQSQRHGALPAAPTSSTMGRSVGPWSGVSGLRSCGRSFSVASGGDLAQAVTGGDGSHSRTDPDLLGTESIDPGLSAEEAALHPLRLRTAPPTALRKSARRRTKVGSPAYDGGSATPGNRLPSHAMWRVSDSWRPGTAVLPQPQLGAV